MEHDVPERFPEHTSGVLQQQDIDYKQKYKALKGKLKSLVYEQECFIAELKKTQKKIVKVTRDKSFLLDRLLKYERIDDSSSDSDATASSDSDAEQKDKHFFKKRKLHTFQRMPPINEKNISTAISLTMNNPTLPIKTEPIAASTPSSGPPPRKRSKSSRRPKPDKKKNTPPMSREELEKHLDSKKSNFIVERTATLPPEIFSNPLSDDDGHSGTAIKKENGEPEKNSNSKTS